MARRRSYISMDQIELQVRFADALVNHYGAVRVEPGLYTNPFGLNGGASYFTLLRSGAVKFGDKKGGQTLSVATLTEIAERRKPLPVKVVDHSHEQTGRYCAA